VVDNEKLTFCLWLLQPTYKFSPSAHGSFSSSCRGWRRLSQNHRCFCI